MYPEKTLTLHLDPPDALPTLDLDNKLDDEQLSVYFSHNLCHQNFYGFNYFEDPSSAYGAFTIDIRCAARSISVEHEFHEHPLSPILSPTLFECHACCTQGLSYMFSTCDFWIHEDCALLPTTFKYRGHVHPLTLCYSSLYDASCRICQEGFRNYQWSYQCRGCQYHAHANCATKTKGCGKQCNGFTFQCTTNGCTFNETFFLDVKCSSLPSYIVHEFHEHPLRLRPNCTIEASTPNACDSEDNDYDPDGSEVDEKVEGDESSSDESDFYSVSEDNGDSPKNKQKLELPSSDDSEDDDYDPDAPDLSDQVKQES
ncbi:hypothetical protein LOK49_LG14G00335 [Camellia lanceoleosa]|uniref:Uncharacterized protein n=1 Tax=Camellia lanceoleosa TaxID=1840588 RepID=A0ACC0FCT8_9ERIC|nr:hypothetical protein LOK49_LG14G00335 [Camellia lanceoleosa]